MRCYSHTFVHDIHFDKTRYQQFLREQGLREHDITHLNIHLITDFTRLHFKGGVDLEEGGAFYGRCKEYMEEQNKMTAGLYRPYDPPSSEYAAIFLRPEQYKAPVRLMDPIFLNHTFLHETRHHIQHCLKLPCCSTVNAGVANEAHSARNQPWEVDAEQFANEHVNQVSFFISVSRPLKRSDLQNLR
jgi:hypothetical protein